MLWLLICHWEAVLEVSFMNMLQAHIALWELTYFKILGRNRTRCKPISTQGRSTNCLGSLPEWITGNCWVSVLMLIRPSIYFENLHAEDILLLLLILQKQAPLEQSALKYILSTHLMQHFKCRIELHNHINTHRNLSLQSQQNFLCMRYLILQ